jgi:LysM repeat protein
MAKRDFTPSEWKLLVSAPQWVYAALAAAERGTVSTRRSEAKALDKFLSGYRTRSTLVKEIIAAQDEADDKIKVSRKKAEQALEDVAALLERKAAGDEGEAVRDMLMDAGKAVAKAHREALFGDAESAKEEKALASIEAALGATQADQNRRRAEEAKAKAEALKQEREAKARAEAARQRDEAAKKAKAEAEAKKKAEAEAKKKAEEAKKKAEAEAKKKAEAAAKKAEAEAKAAELRRKQADARARREAAAKAREEAEAKAAAERIYVVKRGDTLSGIAKELLGKAGRWPEIFEANKDVIENPNLIRPGWKLRIPEK